MSDRIVDYRSQVANPAFAPFEGCTTGRCPSKTAELPQQLQFGSDIHSSRTISVDGQTQADYDRMTSKFKFNQDNYGDAYRESARTGKPIIAVFGSWEKNNSKRVVEGGKNQDAIYLYIDPEKCADENMKKFAQSQLNGHNGCVSIILGVKPGADDKKPEPMESSYRWFGNDPSMSSSIRNEVSKVQQTMNQYSGKFDLGASVPAAPERPSSDAPVKPTPQPLEKPEPTYTFDQFRRKLEADKLFDGDPKDATNYPGYTATHKKLTDDLKVLEALVGPKDSMSDQKNKEKAANLLQELREQQRKEKDLLEGCVSKLKGVPGSEAKLAELSKLLKESETCLVKPESEFNKKVVEETTKQAREANETRIAQAEAALNAAEAQEKARAEAAKKSAEQADTGVRKEQQDASNWKVLKEREEARLTSAVSDTKNAHPETQKAGTLLDAGSSFELLDSNRAHAKMFKARDDNFWASTQRKEMIKVAETDRNAQWRQFETEAKQLGPLTENQKKEQMMLYKGVTEAGRPFAGYDFSYGEGSEKGRIPNHGATWTSRCAEPLVEACKPDHDRKLVSALVPSALCDDRVPEFTKLKLLDGLKQLGTPDTGKDGRAAITREQEIVILNTALKADREKTFSTSYADDLAVGHVRSRDFVAKEVRQFIETDKADQVKFQTAVIQRLAELKAVEVTDALAVSKASPQPQVSRAAEEALAKINPTVTEMRKNIISDPLLDPAKRAANLEAAMTNPRADKRAEAIIRSYGGTEFRDAKEPGFSKLSAIVDDSREDITVRLAAASVLSKAKVEEGRTKATKLAADLFCGDNPIPQYKEAAAAVLSDMVSTSGQREATLSNGRRVLIYKGQNGAITYANNPTPNPRDGDF